MRLQEDYLLRKIPTWKKLVIYIGNLKDKDLYVTIGKWVHFWAKTSNLQRRLIPRLAFHSPFYENASN